MRKGQSALSINDHGTLSGALQHIEACENNGLLPIVGMEGYYVPDHTVKDKDHQKCWHMNFIAKDIDGWRNLARLSSAAHTLGFYGKPRLDMKLIEQFSDGIICGTACMGGWLCDLIKKGDTGTGVDEFIGELKRIFGDDLFIEIMPNGIDDQKVLNPELVNIAQQHSVMVCATVDAHYPFQEWSDTQDVLLMISTGQTVEKRQKKREAGEDVYEFGEKSLYLMDEGEVRVAFKENHPDLPQSVVDESITNTDLIAAKIRPWFLGKQSKLPHVDRDRPALEILTEWCREGMERIGKVGDPVYEERLQFELDTFVAHEVVEFFVLTGEEVVRWARDQGIHVGDGRGSSAASLVSYLSRITMLDPIAYGLLFERFINPDRKGLPDIDIDFPPGAVDMVEDHLKEMRGVDNVIDLVAHQTFGPRSAIRDVGRVLCVPYPRVNSACETIDEKTRLGLEVLREDNQVLDEFAEDFPDCWYHAVRLQGQASRKSEHAAGLIVTDKPVTEYMPVERKGGMHGKLTTPWGETARHPYISDFGFLKIDVLSLISLERQAQCLDMIERDTGERIDLHDLPVGVDPHAVEPEVMQAFSDGLTLGIFQFGGSRSVEGLTRKVKPEWIGDLAAINALHRPAPMGEGLHMDYVERKNGSQPIEYWHESLEPFLKETYGILVYQEQLIQVAEHLGGFTKSEADNFRKIASKLYRDPELAKETMATYHDPFIDGAVSKDVSSQDAEDIWKKLLAFSDYSFNKAHSASYSLLGYYDMWLKVHYPTQFYASLLSNPPSLKAKADRLRKEAIREARSLDIDVLPPDVNRSDDGFTISDGQILFGLESIKNVGTAAVKEIIDKRPFFSYENFEQRVAKKKVNSRVKASLVLAGAFDWCGQRHDFTPDQIEEAELECLGVSLSQQSATSFAPIIEERITAEVDFDDMLDGEVVTAAGEVTELREVVDSRGGRMAFCEVAYGPNHWNCTLFSHVYKGYEELLKSGRPVIVRGVRDTFNGRSSINVEDAMDLGELAELLEKERAVA